MSSLLDIPLPVVIALLVIDFFFYERIRDFFIDWAHIPNNIAATLMAHAFIVFVFGVLYRLFMTVIY